MFINLFLEVFKIFGLLLIAVFILFIVVYIPIKYVKERIYYDDVVEDGILGKLCMMPYLIILVNMLFYLAVCMNFLNGKVFRLKSKPYTVGIKDYMLSLISYLAVFLMVEIIRFIEYKINFDKTSSILLVNETINRGTIYAKYTVNYNEKENFIKFDGKKIPIENIGEIKIIKLDDEPTLHGKDSQRNDGLTEYEIKSIEHSNWIDNDESFRLELVARNPIKYSFK